VSTTYEATPSLLDRIVGADLVVLGVVRGPVRVVPIDGDERRRVHGWFEVHPERILDGEPSSSKGLLVRVIGEGSAERPDWPLPVPSDRPVLAVLTRDVAPGLPDAMYAPCFAGIYEVNADGVVAVPGAAVDDGTRVRTGSTGERLTLDHVERLVDSVRESRVDHLRRLEQEEPGEVRDRPRPELLEQPPSGEDTAPPPPGGGQDAHFD
jgi:hypothetical protein